MRIVSNKAFIALATLLLIIAGWAFMARPMVHDKMVMASEHANCNMLVDSQECSMNLAQHQAATEVPAVITADFLMLLVAVLPMAIGLALVATLLANPKDVPRTPPLRFRESLHKLANHLLLQLRSGILNSKEYERA